MYVVLLEDSDHSSMYIYIYSTVQLLFSCWKVMTTYTLYNLIESWQFCTGGIEQNIVFEEL